MDLHSRQDISAEYWSTGVLLKGKHLIYEMYQCQENTLRTLR